MTELVVFVALTVVSYVLVSLIKRWTLRRQILDIPNERSSHTIPTPRGGGIAIVVLTLFGWLVYGALQQIDFFSILLPYALGAAIIAFVSWLDDLHSLTAYQRFAAHFAGAILVILGIGYWQQVDIPLVGVVSLAGFGIVITILWMVGLTNAYNFMDGIDGISSAQAVVCALGWVLLVGDHPSMDLVRVLGLLIAASSLGFLLHNWSPASIFMGDVGSAFLGFSFAVIPLLITQNQPGYAVVGVLMLWPFVFDTLFTFLARLRRREKVLEPHRSHLYQRLVIAGYPVRGVVLLYTGLAAIGVLAARLWVDNGADVKVVITVLILGLCFGLWLFVNRIETRRVRA